MIKQTSERWHSGASTSHSAIPAALRPWLFARGSLTRKLRMHCAGKVTVRVLAHGWGMARYSERQALGIGAHETAFVREVELACAGRPVVYARTVIPVTTIAKRRRLTRIGNRSLGDVLFADRTMRRGGLAVARLAQANSGPSPRALWGRRSIFVLGSAPLLVTEFFLEVP